MTAPLYTSISLSCDFVTRAVSSSVPIVIPSAGDLFIALSFTGLNDSGAPVSLSPTLSSLSLALKQSDGGEIIVASDSWTLIAGSSPSKFLIHLPLTGEGLSAALSDSSSSNLIGELSWEMANPYSSLFGPASISARSADFALAYANE